MGVKTQSAVILDMDDVLINTSSVIFMRLSLLFEKYPIREGMPYIYHLLANPNREEILGSRYDFSKEFWRGYEKLRFAIRPKPIGNIKSKLESLSQEGFSLGMLTNASLIKVNEFFISSLVDPSIFKIGVYSSDNLPYLKPNPLCFSAIKDLESYGKIFYVGDKLSDFHIARENNIIFKGVCTGLTNNEDFCYLGVKPENIFPSVHEVIFNEKT